MFSVLGEFTDDIINNKYQLLKDRIWKVSVASVVLDTAPIYSKGRLFNIKPIVKELLLYHNTFGFEQQSVKKKSSLVCDVLRFSNSVNKKSHIASSAG
jgi:hypothetical protein